MCFITSSSFIDLPKAINIVVLWPLSLYSSHSNPSFVIDVAILRPLQPSSNVRTLHVTANQSSHFEGIFKGFSQAIILNSRLSQAFNLNLKRGVKDNIIYISLLCIN